MWLTADITIADPQALSAHQQNGGNKAGSVSRSKQYCQPCDARLKTNYSQLSPSKIQVSQLSNNSWKQGKQNKIR